MTANGFLDPLESYPTLALVLQSTRAPFAGFGLTQTSPFCPGKGQLGATEKSVRSPCIQRSNELAKAGRLRDCTPKLLTVSR